jgi:hypothetical protein
MEAAARSEREILLARMRARPDSAWPRGSGHIVLGVPGSPPADKAYVEPGGSFSPGFGTFGISITAHRADLTSQTGDQYPLDVIRQWFERNAGSPLPTVCTQTPDYAASWSWHPDGWELNLSPIGHARLVVSVRSAGPAGAPLNSIVVNNGRIIAGAWSISADPAFSAVALGLDDPSTLRGDRVATRDEQGWCRADAVVQPRATRIVVARSSPHGGAHLPDHASGCLRLDLPDPAFCASLLAQVDHLRMSLVGDETRPGDPNHYPLAWLRDGAFSIVALARSGETRLADLLARHVATHDFYGGFGSEGDAPGLALWAIASTAMACDNPTLVADVWPDIVRKAALIEEMAATSEPIRKPWCGPIVPAHRGDPDLDLVCKPATDCLINGMMDMEFPVLYVTAMSALGLRAAAAAAVEARMEPGPTWSHLAALLTEAWNRQLDRAPTNERTGICGLHPAWVARDLPKYAAALVDVDPFEPLYAGTAADTSPAPEWTYFELAKAHQWLLLGDPERAWRRLRWFWAHQASPGLYTWWEGSGEENTFGRWESVRGWAEPAHVTPHYWTAAEMLLLQLAMLAHVSATTHDELVVGAGVPRTWLDVPLSVDGMATWFGRTGWWYADGLLRVATDRPCRVRPAGALEGVRVEHVIRGCGNGSSR